MHKRTVAAIAATLLAVTLVPAAATANPVASQPTSQTDNIEHITNVQLPDIPGRSGGGRATDSDFIEFTVPEEGWELPAPTEVAPGVVLPPPDYEVTPGETRLFNLMGTYNRGLHILDITDRENPVLVAIWDCGVLQADVFAFQQEQEDGSIRQLAAYTQDATNGGVRSSACFEDMADRGQRLPGNSRGTFIADVTDPYRPWTVSFLDMRKGSHQTTVHPSGNYIYNSAAVVVTTHWGTIEVFDVSTPEEPEMVHELDLIHGLDSHDMSFSEDGDRAFVAALTHSFVLDTSDPAQPEILGRVFDPSINIHHDAHSVTVDTPAGERTYLLIGDEQGGAGASVYCPGGGIHVFDITGPLERAPVKVGAFFIEDTRIAGPCTAHVIQVLAEQELLVMGWYRGGALVLDYSGLAGVAVGKLGVEVGITEVAHSRFSDSTLWSAKVPEVAEDGSFYIYGGDMARHVDVWKFDPNGDGEPETTGQWLTPEQAAELARPAAVGYASCMLSG
jgi:hypothetical protein